MPEPTFNQVHINRPLTNISQAYMQDNRDFIADKVFPVVPVLKQSDRYFVYTKGDWFRDEAQLRGPGTESAGGGYTLDNTPSYYAPVYAFHKDVDDQVRTNSDDPLNADRDATMFITERMLLKREVLLTSIIFTTRISLFRSIRCVIQSVASRSALSGSSLLARTCGSTSLWNA